MVRVKIENGGWTEAIDGALRVDGVMHKLSVVAHCLSGPTVAAPDSMKIDDVMVISTEPEFGSSVDLDNTEFELKETGNLGELRKRLGG